MINLQQHQREYQYDKITLVRNCLTNALCDSICNRIVEAIRKRDVALVDHEGLGTLDGELDGGGRYLHHLFKSADVSRHCPELVGAYQALLPLVSLITCTHAVLSPYQDSDLNIKAYPADGGTIGGHFDTNGITALIYLTDNSEGALRTQIERSHPSSQNGWLEEREILSEKGMLLLMQGREVWHWSEATVTESKYVAVLNYYEKGDTWRPNHFDRFVYDGIREADVAKVS